VRFTERPEDAVDVVSVIDPLASPHLGALDLLFVAVKRYDVDDAVRAIVAALPEQAVIVPLANGLGAAEALRCIAPGRPVCDGLVYACATRTDGEQVVNFSGLRVVLERPPGGLPASVTAWQASVDADRAPLEVTVASDFARDKWRKLIATSAANGICALLDSPQAGVLATPPAAPILAACVEEGVRVARACGIALDGADADALVGSVRRLPAPFVPSLMPDLRRGGRTEVPFMSGALARIGAATGIDTPTHRRIVELFESSTSVARSGDAMHESSPRP